MNIFVLDKDPMKSAQMMCDAHVVKMIVESCQLLSTHDRISKRWCDESGLYKPTHIGHPCRMCLEQPYNRLWLIWHLNELLSEYSYRYHKVHKCQELFDRYWRHDDMWKMVVHIPPSVSAYNSAVARLYALCDLPKCMPDEFKDSSSVVQSYRNYYKHKQNTMKYFRYTNREIPEWLRGITWLRLSCSR